MDRAHRITEFTPLANEVHDDIHSLQQAASSKRPRIALPALPQGKVNRLRDLQIALIVDIDLPFTTYENKYLQELFFRYDDQLASQMPWGKTTIRKDLQRLYEENRGVIKQQLQDALTQIHLSFDLWTSPSRQAIMGVVGHFIDGQKHHQARLLALRHQPGNHTGDHLAKTLFEVVKSWGIIHKVGTVVCDNASNNDTCLKAFYRLLDPTMCSSDATDRRMRCYGHILNLVARAFLFGKDAETFELQSQANVLLNAVEADLLHWRKKGPVGKLHNIVKFIRASPQRSERFKARAKEEEDSLPYRLHEESTTELELLQNNETRWNSTYMMIQRAFKKQSDITAFFTTDLTRDDADDMPHADDILNVDDWRILGEIMHILKPLYDQTMLTQGWGKGNSHGRLWEVMTGIEFVLGTLEDWKAFYNIDAATEAAQEVADSQLSLRSPSISHRTIPPPSTPSTPIGSRPSRSRHLPARLDDYEVVTPSRRSQIRRQAALSHQFDEGALPAHTREAYTSISRSASQLSRQHDMTDRESQSIRASINGAWKKLNGYYLVLGQSPLYAAAVILHPTLGLAYLERNWTSEDLRPWIQVAKDSLRAYLERWYLQIPVVEAIPRPQRCPRQTEKGSDDQYKQWFKKRVDSQGPTDDELDRYYRLEQQDPASVIQWWIDHQSTFPALSKLALDLWAIPAMAADCERAFSLAKLTTTSQRLSMQTETLEVTQCLKNWSRHGDIRLGGSLRRDGVRAWVASTP
jgi:hypothetical protein